MKNKQIEASLYGGGFEVIKMDQLNEMLQQVLDELCILRKKVDAISQLEALTGTKSNLVSTGEAALMLDVSVHTIREWHQQNKMPKNLGMGKHLKFERSAIEKMAKAKKAGRPRKAA